MLCICHHSFIYSFIHSFVQRHRYSGQYKTKNMNSKQDSPGSGNKLLRWPPKIAQNIPNVQNINHIIKHLKNTLKSVKVDPEDRARERELKSTTSGRKFHAFTICSLKKFARVRETRGFLDNLNWWPALVEANYNVFYVRYKDVFVGKIVTVCHTVCKQHKKNKRKRTHCQVGPSKLTTKKKNNTSAHEHIQTWLRCLFLHSW